MEDKKTSLENRCKKYLETLRPLVFDGLVFDITGKIAVKIEYWGVDDHMLLKIYKYAEKNKDYAWASCYLKQMYYE